MRPYINSDAEIAVLRDGINAQLPNFLFSESIVEYQEELCAVCLDNFTSGAEVKKLPCKHLFHSSCILE